VARKIEKRQHPRMPITLPAIMVTEAGVIEGEIENISLSGAFISCQEQLDSGERLAVVAELPTNPSFSSHAEVVWSRVPGSGEEGTNPGMGVKFIGGSRNSLRLLEAQFT
jgi:hypothetical protein